MPRRDSKLFTIYEDPDDRIPTPGTEPAEICTLRAQIEAVWVVIVERDELLAEAAEVFESTRETTAGSQIMEAKEMVERVRIEKLIKKREKITVELEMQVSAVEMETEQLVHAIEEKEEETQELEGEKETLRKRLEELLDMAALGQRLEGLMVEEEDHFEKQEREERRLAGTSRGVEIVGREEEEEE